MAKPIIEIDKVGKRYRIRGQREPYLSLRDEIGKTFSRPRTKDQGRAQDFWALRDVSFSVNEGEAVGIIGRNGAGKSTLLKILSNITPPTEGGITMRGRVASLLEVGTGFHPELTGRENIYLNGAILGMTRGEVKRKFDEIVAFAEVEKFLETPVKRYSSGMYVRLAFAVAAHLEPEILLVDEVLAVGDAAFQKKCLGKMEDVAKGGRTVLFVSHSMPSIEALCGRVIMLHDGSVTMDGESHRVVTRYLSLGSDVTSAEVDLSGHAGRSHSREPALLRAWVVRNDGTPDNKVRMGGSLTFCFQFKSQNPILNPGFGAIIEDEHGRGLFSLNNYTIPTEKNTFRSLDSGIAQFCVPNLPLLPGAYFITLTLTEDDRTWIDCVERALAIQIQSSDVYGTGRIPDSTYGPLYVSWDVTVSRDWEPGLPAVTDR